VDFVLLISGSFAFLGAIVASFIGVLSERVYTGQSWVKSRSRCDSCRVPLTPLDLIPVLSWFFSFGRCRSCGSKVSALHPVFELSLGALFALAALKTGLTAELVLFLGALSVLAFIVLYDLRHTLVPVPSSAWLVVLSLSYAFVSAPSFGEALLVAGIIGLGFLLLHVCSKGKAMGLADTPVAFSLSLLAAPHAVAGLLFSFWIGAVWGIAVLVMRRGGPTMKTEVPFVPFLALGYLLAYFTGWNPLPL
jgi:leader peptidase (prepilin peptidase) / N-methyltransferase